MPPRKTPGHLTFLKNFGQIPRYVASLDGQMPNLFELQRGSNPPPSRHVKVTVKQQWATKAVEILLGNDAFGYLSICSILFASSVNSLIPPAPQFNVV